MSNTLQIQFYLKEHPYPDDINAVYEAWGQIDLTLSLHATRAIVLLSTEWNVIPLAGWLIDNWHLICAQFLSVPNNAVPIETSEGIAQAIHRLQEEQVEDEWFDALYDFREHHSLRFGLRGANIPEIFLGYNRGEGEISSETEFESWFYSFNSHDFYIALRQNLHKCFKQYLETASNTMVIEKVQALQSRLEHV